MNDPNPLNINSAPFISKLGDAMGTGEQETIEMMSEDEIDSCKKLYHEAIRASDYEMAMDCELALMGIGSFVKNFRQAIENRRSLEGT